MRSVVLNLPVLITGLSLHKYLAVTIIAQPAASPRHASHEKKGNKPSLRDQLMQVNTTKMETLSLLQLVAKLGSLYHQAQSCASGKM